jgi:uncharacterized protein YdeI (BOF family)
VIDVSFWYYEGDTPPQEPGPIAWDIAAADSLPSGSIFFIHAVVSDWTNEGEGEGEIDDGSNSMAIKFKDSLDIPELNDSVYILGLLIGDSLDRTALAYDWMSDFSAGFDDEPEGLPMSICGILEYQIEEFDVFTVGTVTQFLEEDRFILTSEGCSVECEVGIDDLPLIGFEILIQGQVEDGILGVEIDVSDWVLIDDGREPEPPPTVSTVEEALAADIYTIAGLSGNAIEYVDEVLGVVSFTDPTGTMNMDFRSDDMPDLQQSINVQGVVEWADTSKVIDVSFWYYEGDTPPQEPGPIAWDIAAADSLPVGTICFIYATVSGWTNESGGEGQIDDGSNSMAVDFVDSIDFPELNDSLYILGLTVGEGLDRAVLAYHWMSEFTVGIVEPVNMHPEIKIYPNPAFETLYIETENDISRAILYNMEGKVVMDVSLIENSMINVSNLEPGIYVISLFNGKDYLGFNKVLVE